MAKELMLDGIRPEFTILALVATVRCFLILNCLQPKMWWSFKDSKWVLLSHGAGVDDGGI